MDYYLQMYIIVARSTADEENDTNDKNLYLQINTIYFFIVRFFKSPLF